MTQIDRLYYNDALVGMVTAAFVILFAILYLQRYIRRARSQFSTANVARLLLALGGLSFGLGFFSNSLALAWLLAWTGPYELIPHPYDTLLDWGNRAGVVGAILFGGTGAVLGLYAWRRQAAPKDAPPDVDAQ